MPKRANLTDPKFADPLGTSPLLDFAERVFASSPAMVKKEPVNGHRMWTKFDESRYNATEYDIVAGMWDHEHCSVCYERIADGDRYWENSESHILCPQCYEEFQATA